MIELSGNMQLGEQIKLNFGGDVLNTALYYSRLGGNASFLTALGDDIFSKQLISLWESENINTSEILILKNKVPGLYAIETDNSGERNFHYWREEAPVKDLFDNISIKKLNNYIEEYKYLYFSGISLSRWNEKQLNIFCNWLEKFKNTLDKEIIFDLNYRPKCWVNNQQTKKYLNKILPFVTMIITTFDDEILLFNDKNHNETLSRYQKYNIETVIIKDGAKPITVFNKNKVNHVKNKIIVEKPIDTTSAGDSFNGAFLACFNVTQNIKKSIDFAQSVAVEVISHQGAIIDKKYTDKYLNIIKDF